MKVIFHDLFYNDLKEGASYYEESEPDTGLGDAFINEVKNTIDQIEKDIKVLTPKPIYRDVCRTYLKRFKKNSIRYRILNEQNTLQVLGVFHGSRRSSYGKNRK